MVSKHISTSSINILKILFLEINYQIGYIANSIIIYSNYMPKYK